MVKRTNLDGLQIEYNADTKILFLATTSYIIGFFDLHECYSITMGESEGYVYIGFSHKKEPYKLNLRSQQRVNSFINFIYENFTPEVPQTVKIKPIDL